MASGKIGGKIGRKIRGKIRGKNNTMIIKNEFLNELREFGSVMAQFAVLAGFYLLVLLGAVALGWL